MIVETISDHFIERTAERIGLFLRTSQSQDDVINAINQNSIFIRDEARNRAAYLSKIGDRFYIVIAGKDKELVTVIYPSSSDRTLAIKRFERHYEKDMFNESVQCYVSWRGDLAVRQGWKKEPPKVRTNKGNIVGPKMILLWGDYIEKAQWDGSQWLDEKAAAFDSFLVWGWKDIEIFEKQKNDSDKIKGKTNCIKK